MAARQTCQSQPVSHAVPELRSASALRGFNKALGECDYDLKEWRNTKVMSSVALLAAASLLCASVFAHHPGCAASITKQQQLTIPIGERVDSRYVFLQGYRYDFDLLDRKGGAAWDLAQKLICRRNAVNRGRLSAAGALAHRFFLPEL